MRILNSEQLHSQISSSHRLINLTSSLRHCLDTSTVFGNNFDFISQEYFFNEILGRLIETLSMDSSRRQNVILKNIRIKYGNYNHSKEDYIYETLCDNYFFKNTKKYISKEEIKNISKKAIKEQGVIYLVMPILSRKPLSPVKNKGNCPDLGEIYTLLKCFNLAKMLSKISGEQCCFLY
ncbi:MULTISPECIES: hypothetical protein [Pasteurellaceae]|uniref:Uncharacterized protein n=1 Tax=Rodentibacter genomosp. 1 TaxID=1908264 RepID=A0A1V3J5Y8_9PAST|nr:hypothetical protein [Rodentibacter genomosp. 1]MBF0752479.1 hypothetical protein [Pasteurella sp. 19428wF3_WM03]OOF50320.1 hypothetical protein BKK54_06645 [Rodentibacter genomosp. 1]TFU49805.1 hypothetical protein E4T92_10150 [Pasteurella sp. WM03]